MFIFQRIRYYPKNIIYFSNLNLNQQRLNSTKIKTKLDLKKFINFENDLNKISIKDSSIDSKINFLLKYNNKLNIFDLNLPINKYSIVFKKLINNYKINFNKIKINGIGTFLKLILKNSINGIELIKNCGILNYEDRDLIFKNQYNKNLQLLTISILIDNKFYNDAYHFIKIYDLLNPKNNDTIKFKFKLSKFNEFNKFFKINSLEIINNNLIHLYLNDLIKSSLYSSEEKIEFYLLILFKYLELNKLKNFKNSINQIKILNSKFLLLLNNQISISYSIFLSYFIKLYPNSIQLLKDLCLISTSNSILKNNSPDLNDLPIVNIKNDLIQLNSQPFINDIALLYSKYLNEKLPNRTTTKQLFNLYIKNVKYYQLLNNNSNNNLIPHPFDSKFHDSSILLSFLNYTFNLKIGLNKPKLSSNLILKFYNNIKTCRINKNQINEFQLLIKSFSTYNSSSNIKFNFIILTKLLNEFNNQNIILNIEIYFNLINLLIKLDFIENAKQIYLFLINHPILSKNIKINHVNELCYRFLWPFPTHLLEIKNLNENGNENSLIKNEFTFKNDYLIPPDNLIKLLDLQLEMHRKVDNDI